MSEEVSVEDRPRFALGSIVRHRDFGRGRIVAYDRDRYVILFPGGDAKGVAFDFDGLAVEESGGDPELTRIVDDNWDPPVTASVRLVSIVDDSAQHLGQAAYLKGTLAPT